MRPFVVVTGKSKSNTNMHATVSVSALEDSDVGKLSDFISCAYVLQESLQTLQREVLCPPQSCYIQQIKCLKRAFDKITTIQTTCLVLQSSKLLLNQLVTFCCSVGKLALLFYKLCIVSMGNVMSIQ